MLCGNQIYGAFVLNRRVDLHAIDVHLDRLLHGLDGAKDKYYALYALTQCLSSATMWAEPYLCDSLLVKYGGHVVFDYSIPLAFIVYLAAASRMEPRGAKAKAA